MSGARLGSKDPFSAPSTDPQVANAQAQAGAFVTLSGLAGTQEFKDFQSTSLYQAGAQPVDVYKAFTAWKSQQGASDLVHKNYLDIVGKNPGRQGTILVPTSGKNQPGTVNPNPDATVLTATSRKTVLG